jgi:hypothetical protein
MPRAAPWGSETPIRAHTTRVRSADVVSCLPRRPQLHPSPRQRWPTRPRRNLGHGRCRHGYIDELAAPKPRRHTSVDDGFCWTRADWWSAHGVSNLPRARGDRAWRGASATAFPQPGAGDVQPARRADRPSSRSVAQERIDSMPLARSLGTVRRARNRVDNAQRGPTPGLASVGITGTRPPARTRRSQRFASSTLRISSSG